MPEATSTLTAGDLVGNYQILGLAGAGGMGVVYRARDRKLERTVALKFLPDELVATQADKERFLREARTASSLDHPNVGVIHGIEETHDGHSFIVMAFYDGETLSRKILRGPLSVREAVDTAIQIARGLAAAHAGTVIHRDIKPSNIIITQNNVVKIVDFGLARHSAPAGTTQTLGASGTIGYMSPEQSMGKVVTQRTDIWALGVVISEMVTGKNPFQRDSAGATIVAILNEPPAPVDAAPIDLQRIIYRALSKDAANRYSTCDEIVADLEECQSHLQPGSTSGLTAPRQVAPPSAVRARSDIKKQIEHASRPMWTPASPAAGTRRMWLIAPALALLGVLALLAFMPPVRQRIAELFGRQEDHIAVLPFDNVGGDPANEVVSAGLIDNLASRLTNLEVGKQSLWVVPSGEVRRRKITDPASALRELGATIVVQGSLQRTGQKIHLTVNLINTSNLRQIGSVALEDAAGDFSVIEDEAVARLAKLMHIDATPEMLRATGGAASPAAYEGYLKALGYTQRYDKAGNLDLAITALNAALKTDPRFALGWAQLGEAYRLKYQLDHNTEWTDEALANCQKAAELDDRLPAVYVTLGRVHHSTGKYDLALQEFQRALQLDPHNSYALIGLANSYDSAGRTADAEAAFRKAIALRPDYWDGYNALASFLDDHQRYDESIAQFRHAIELTPDNASLYLNLGAVYIDKGDPTLFADAEQALRKSIALDQSYGAYANLGYLYIQEKKYTEAAAAVEKALQLNDKDYLVWGNLAIAYEGLNDHQRAAKASDRELNLLEQAVQAAPRDAVTQSVLGLLYAKKKLREKAVQRLQSALALSPDDANVLENAGEAYEELGDRAQALQYITRSVEKGYSLTALRNIPDLKLLLSDPSFRPNGK